MKNKNNFYKNCTDLYKKYIESKEKIDEYKEIEVLYHSIKDSYSEKIKNKEINIKIERIQLEKKLGKYNGILMNMNINLVFIFVGAFIASIISEFTDTYINKGITIIVVSFLLILFFVYKYSSKIILNDKNREFVYNISLIVLDELEREKYSEWHRKIFKGNYFPL